MASTFFVPLGGMLLLFMLVMMAAPALLNSVLEEKMQKIVEVLVASVSPFELFSGKLLGTVLVSWTLSFLYLGGITAVVHHAGYGHLIQPATIGWFLVLQFFALLIFGSLFSALGAACSEIRDAQSMMMPAMLLVMIPMLTFTTVLKDPGGVLARSLTFFPPSTPFILLLRVLTPPGPSGLEVVVAFALMAAFTVLVVWAAGRIFRVGLLSTGQTPTFRQLLSWVTVR